MQPNKAVDFYGNAVENSGDVPSFIYPSRTSEQIPAVSAIQRPISTVDDPSHNWNTITCCHCGYSFRIPVFCGNRFCPICSGRRRARTKRRITWLVHNVKHGKGYRLKMLTLTIRSLDNLDSMVKRITGCFKALRATRYWKEHIDGGASVIEVTGSPGNWHAHLHILLSSRFVKWDVLHAQWKRISGSTGVFIQNIQGKQAVNYVTKYVTKSDCSPGDQLEVSDSLKGTRLFQPFGSWYAVSNACPDVKPPCPQCKANDWSIDFMAFRPTDGKPFR